MTVAGRATWKFAKGSKNQGGISYVKSKQDRIAHCHPFYSTLQHRIPALNFQAESSGSSHSKLSDY